MIAFLSSIFEMLFIFCGNFALKTQSRFNNNAIILFFEDHNIWLYTACKIQKIEISTLPSRCLQNKTYASLFRIVNLIDELHQANCIRFKFIYFYHELLFPFVYEVVHNSQFFLDFLLLHACVERVI